MTYLGARYGQEAHAHHHTGDGDLAVAKLDSVEVKHREGGYAILPNTTERTTKCNTIKLRGYEHKNENQINHPTPPKSRNSNVSIS